MNCRVIILERFIVLFLGFREVTCIGGTSELEIVQVLGGCSAKACTLIAQFSLSAR